MAEPTDHPSFPLSVLDLAPDGRGATPADALRNSIELVQEVERLGYRRHWRRAPTCRRQLSPPVPPPRLGDVDHPPGPAAMLPNHAALAVAEKFGC